MTRCLVTLVALVVVGVNLLGPAVAEASRAPCKAIRNPPWASAKITLAVCPCKTLRCL